MEESFSSPCTAPSFIILARQSLISTVGLWQFKFASECVADVAARTLTAEAPSYATIMELDKKVREFPLPEGSLNTPTDFSSTFQKCVLEHIRETSMWFSFALCVGACDNEMKIIVLLYIHRSFFAQAIIEYPINPLKSPYAPSFLAAYRASSTILKSIRQQFDIWPNSSSRFWVMWTFAFSAAVRSCFRLPIAGADLILGCIWNGRYSWAEVAISAFCNVRVGPGVHFVFQGVYL